MTSSDQDGVEVDRPGERVTDRRADVTEARTLRTRLDPMPRIPRRSEGNEEAPPEDQRTQVSSGDPLEPPTPAPQSAATSGDPLTQVVPPQQPDATDLSSAPPVTPASTAAPSDAGVAPGDASSTQATGAPAEGEPPTDASGTQAPEAPAEDEQPTVAAPPVEPQTAVTAPQGDTGATSQPPTADAGAVATEAGAAGADTGPATATGPAAAGAVSAEAEEQAPADARPRFRQRTRMRRRLRYLRRLRELAFRDLGGLVFDLHRFGRDRNDLVTAKLEALANIDRELRTLQETLADRRDFTDLREAGIAACARCGTLHDTDANYCPGCGTTLRSTLVRDAFPVTVTPTADAEQQPPQSTTTT